MKNRWNPMKNHEPPLPGRADDRSDLWLRHGLHRSNEGGQLGLCGGKGQCHWGGNELLSSATMIGGLTIKEWGLNLIEPTNMGYHMIEKHMIEWDFKHNRDGEAIALSLKNKVFLKKSSHYPILGWQGRRGWLQKNKSCKRQTTVYEPYMHYCELSIPCHVLRLIPFKKTWENLQTWP